MQGHSDRIVRWEPTGAEKAVEVQEAWIKKLNVMKCCKGKTSSMPTPPRDPPQTQHRHTHTHTYARAHRDFKRQDLHTPPCSPLPQPASPAPPDPVILSSPVRLITPSPPIYRCSPVALQSSTCSLPSSHSRSLPTGRLSVDVTAGNVVSNSPSDTGLLTFHCTLRKEGFFSGITPHRLWRLPVHSGALAWPWTGRKREGVQLVGESLCCHSAECQAWPPPGGLQADSRQTCYLLPENTSEEDVRQHRGQHITCPRGLSIHSAFTFMNNLHPNTVQVTSASHPLCLYSCHQPLNDALIWHMIKNLFHPAATTELCLKVLPRKIAKWSSTPL